MVNLTGSLLIVVNWYEYEYEDDNQNNNKDTSNNDTNNGNNNSRKDNYEIHQEDNHKDYKKKLYMFVWVLLPAHFKRLSVLPFEVFFISCIGLQPLAKAIFCPSGGPKICNIFWK